MKNDSPDAPEPTENRYNALNNQLFEMANEPHEDSDDSQDEPPQGGWSRKRILALIAAVVAIALLAIGIFNAINRSSATPEDEPTVSRNANPGIDGIIAKDVPVTQLQVGDCIRSFAGPLEKATVVTCTTDHNAQLIGNPQLKNQNPGYPGNEAVSADGLEACKAITLNVASLGGVNWRYEYSRPSKETWATGDREIGCFLKSEGTTTKTSLLPAASAAPTSKSGAASSSSPASKPAATPSPSPSSSSKG
ncbi:hypothetical protein ACXA45_07610 [Neomicrococcus lactis]